MNESDIYQRIIEMFDNIIKYGNKINIKYDKNKINIINTEYNKDINFGEFINSGENIPCGDDTTYLFNRVANISFQGNKKSQET